MMAQNGEYLGVSEPLSTAAPKPHDLKLAEALMAELKAQNNFEAPEETQKREIVLQRLEKLLKELVIKVGKSKGLPVELLKDAGGKIFTFGSYRLKVFGPGSDIDALMIAPKHVTRDDFFEHMPDMIRSTVSAEELGELVTITDASVPMIATKIQDVDVDLAFCALQISKIPKNLDLNNNELLRGLDQIDLRCVNGTRVTDRLLSLVPETKTFRLALRAVKLWAQQRAIYGNVFGFPGGVAYGMLVARVCQLYPKAAASTIIQKFFFVIGGWNWPSPVLLQKREVVPFMNEREWDPQVYGSNRHDLLPIITPAYPCMNSTFGVQMSNRTIFKKELQRGLKITNEIFNGTKPWQALFERHTFFTQDYKHYICIVTSSKTKEAQEAWQGWIKSRTRRIIGSIESSGANSVKLVQPYNKAFEAVHQCPTAADVEAVKQGDTSFQVAKTKAVDDSMNPKVAAAETGDAAAIAQAAAESAASDVAQQDGPQEIFTTRYYLGIELEEGSKSLDISQPIAEFKRDVYAWERYDSELHFVSIKHVRDHQLPPDVFIEGEKRPIKKKAKKAKESAPAAGPQQAFKKRSLSSAGLDENQDPAKRRHSGFGQTKTNGINASAG